jgi:hypothetical protein
VGSCKYGDKSLGFGTTELGDTECHTVGWLAFLLYLGGLGFKPPDFPVNLFNAVDSKIEKAL